MSRKTKPLIESIADRDQLIDAILERFLIAHDMPDDISSWFRKGKVWLAEAIIARDFDSLRELLDGYRETDRAVFVEVTGLRLPKGSGKKPYSMLREWCGLTSAWQEHDEAKRALSVEYQKLDKRYGGRTDSMVEGLQQIYADGWTEIRQLTDQAGNSFEGLFRPGRDNEYHPLSGPGLKKQSLFAVAGKYWKALMRLRAAEAVLAVENDRKRRAEITQRAGQVVQAQSAVQDQPIAAAVIASTQTPDMSFFL